MDINPVEVRASGAIYSESVGEQEGFSSSAGTDNHLIADNVDRGSVSLLNPSSGSEMSDARPIDPFIHVQEPVGERQARCMIQCQTEWCRFPIEYFSVPKSAGRLAVSELQNRFRRPKTISKEMPYPSRL